jgi:hypothetical protein
MLALPQAPSQCEMGLPWPRSGRASLGPTVELTPQRKMGLFLALFLEPVICFQ